MPVEVVGGVQLKKALNKYEPDLAKAMRKEIGSYLKPVVNAARSYVPSIAPLSGWDLGSTPKYGVNYRPFPKFYAPRMKSGIGYSSGNTRPNKSGFTYLARIYNKSAAGAIYETAGRLNPFGSPRSRSLNPNAGRQFIQAMPPITKGYGSPRADGKPPYKMDGRLIYRAWAETNGQVVPKVIAAMAKAKVEFNRRKAIKEAQLAARLAA